MRPSSMELSSVVSPPYTGFLRRFDPQFYFSTGTILANTAAHTGCGVPSATSKRSTKKQGCLHFNPPNCHSPVPSLQEPNAEPLDLRTKSYKLDKPCIQQDSTIPESVSDTNTSRSDSESPAKLVLIKFCDCFTGKNRIGDYCACYCNETPVYIPRSRLLPFIDDEKDQTLGKLSPAPNQFCNQRSPSMTFSSLDESPPPLVIDISRSPSDREQNISRVEEEKKNSFEPLSLSQEARRIYDFASDEELKSLGPFSSFRCNIEPVEHVHLPTCDINSQIEQSSNTPATHKVQGDHETSLLISVDSSQNLTIRPEVPGEEDCTVADTLSHTFMCEQNTQDYNADISTTQVSIVDSSDLEAPDVHSWYVKQDVDKSPTPLRLKLCKTFVIENSDQDKAEGQNRETDTKLVKESLARKRPAVKGNLTTVISRPSTSSNIDASQRFVEGRSICEPSTIFSISPPAEGTSPMSSCVSYPDTPDITFNAHRNSGDLLMASTPTRCYTLTTSNRKSSTPNVKSPVKLKDALKVKKASEQTSLRKALFQRKISAQGSDSILNIGFTSDLEIDDQNPGPSPNSEEKGDGGSSKKTKSKKTSFFKVLRQKMMCQNNISVMSSLENTRHEEASCSERVKAALEPLTTKYNRIHALGRPSIQFPRCGKTATTSTATVAFATLNEIKLLGSTVQPKSTIHQEPSAAPQTFNTFSPGRTLATMPSLRHLVAPIDLSAPDATCKSLDGRDLIESYVTVANRKSDKPCTVTTTVPTPTAVEVEKSQFKVPEIPYSPRTPVGSNRRVHLKASIADVRSQHPFCPQSKEKGVKTSMISSESSLSETNLTTLTTQQSFDMREMKRSARGVAELLTAFITDASISQFGTQLYDTLQKTMLFSLCEKCGVRVKESKEDPSIVNLVKSRRSRTPTEDDVKQLIRRARRTRYQRPCSELL